MSWCKSPTMNGTQQGIEDGGSSTLDRHGIGSVYNILKLRCDSFLSQGFVV